jgi:hypothetical protein
MKNLITLTLPEPQMRFLCGLVTMSLCVVEEDDKHAISTLALVRQDVISLGPKGYEDFRLTMIKLARAGRDVCRTSKT